MEEPTTNIDGRPSDVHWTVDRPSEGCFIVLRWDVVNWFWKFAGTPQEYANKAEAVARMEDLRRAYPEVHPSQFLVKGDDWLTVAGGPANVIPSLPEDRPTTEEFAENLRMFLQAALYELARDNEEAVKRHLRQARELLEVFAGADPNKRRYHVKEWVDSLNGWRRVEGATFDKEEDRDDHLFALHKQYPDVTFMTDNER